MITDFDDFVTWMYVIIDDVWQQIAPYYRHPGPAPTTCSDNELLTMALVAECREWDKETNALAQWRDYPHLFPHLPERSRFNRRRNLAFAINHIRQVVLSLLDVALNRPCALDSLPVPVINVHLVPGSTGDWDAYGASYGGIASKKQTIYGYTLHLLVTLGGVILDFTLTGAHASDGTAAKDMVFNHTDRDSVADKVCISTQRTAALREYQRIRLLTLPRRNQKRQVPRGVRRTVNRVRQIVEPVNGQLTEQLHVETNHATSFAGLRARLYTKLAAHTVCIYLNRLLGNPDCLHVKQ